LRGQNGTLGRSSKEKEKEMKMLEESGKKP
jgi:hypothetical protein